MKGNANGTKSAGVKVRLNIPRRHPVRRPSFITKLYMSPSSFKAPVSPINRPHVIIGSRKGINAAERPAALGIAYPMMLEVTVTPPLIVLLAKASGIDGAYKTNPKANMRQVPAIPIRVFFFILSTPVSPG